MKEPEQDVTFKGLFIPFTTLKAIFCIIVIGLVVYANSLFNNFLGDDKLYIIDYTPAHTINLSIAFGPSIFNTDGQYRPIPALFFSILYVLFGTNAFFYHVLQLSLHITCTIVLLVLLRKFLSLPIAFLCVLIFLIHPIQVESVSYISQTASLLFFLFGMFAFLLSLREKLTVNTLILIHVLLLFAFLIKETSVLFLLVILTYSFLFKRHHTIKLLGVGFLSFLFYIFFRYFLGHVGFDTRQLSPLAMTSLSIRLLTIPSVIFYYVKAFVFPNALAYDQQWITTSIDIFHFYLPLAADLLFILAICLAGLFIFKHRKHTIKLFSVFCIWFFSGLFMVLQIYPLDATVADRWFYFPLVGLVGIIGMCIQLVTDWPIYIRKLGVIIVCCILVLLSLRTIIRNSDWFDGLTLFSRDVKVSDNANIEENLAYELVGAYRYNEALLYLQKSAKILPHATNLYDIGYLYEQQHDYQKAKYYYGLGIEKKEKGYGQDQVRKYLYGGMARILTFHDNPKTAEVFLKDVLKLYPNEGSYWSYLAIVEYNLGNYEEALKAAEKAKILLNNPSANTLFSRISSKKPLNLHMQ